jgi:transglutaminase-like putative cysteine protease
MKRKYLGACLVVAIFSISPVAFAQEKTQSFEEHHSDKSYIFLLVQDDVKVNADWSFTSRVHRKVLIQKEDAKDMGEIPIRYDRDYDRITQQQIFTVTPEGKKLPPIKIQNMAVYDGEPMYSNAMVRVLSMPAVGIGSVMDVDYTISSKGLPMKDAFWTIESVRQSVPVKEYRYTITFPKKLGLGYREFGLTQKPEITEKNGWLTYRWVLKDLYDNRQDEEYVPPPSPDDPMEAFEFSSVKSWDQFAAWYSGLIDKNTVMTPEIIAKAKSVVGNTQLVRDKVRAVLEFVQDNFRYVSMSFGENVFEPHSTKDVFANRYGDCKDLSLLTKAMLEAVGVKSHIALFNTEGSINDPAYDLPIPNLFNHALLLVEDPLVGDFYADPLLKGYDIGQYPMAFQRAFTFVISNGKGRFDRFPEFDAERAAERTNQVVDMNEDWSGVFEISKVWDLDSSIRTRDSLKAMNDDQKKEMYEQLEFMMAKGGEVTKRELEGLDHRYGRLRSSLQFRRPDEFPSADGLIVIDLDGIDRDAAFEKKERRENFFFGANGIFEIEYIYRIPAGFEILYVPSDLKLDGPYLSFIRTFKRTPLGVTVKETVKGRRVMLKKEAIQELRAFHADLSRQTRQRIVFKKVNK